MRKRQKWIILLLIASLIVSVPILYHMAENSRERKLAMINAIEAKNFNLVKYYLDHGSDPNMVITDSDYDPQWLRNRFLRYFHILFVDSPYEETPLHCAAGGGNAAIVNILLSKGALVNTRVGIDKETPLLLSMRAGKYEIAKLLLENHADPCLQNHNGSTALILAVQSSQVPLIKLLVFHKKCINSVDSNGMTARDWATKLNKTNLLPLLQ